MAAFTTSRYFITLYFLILYCFKTLTANPNLSFNFNNFGNYSNFESQLALYGNAKVVNGGGSSLQITGSSISSAGRVMYKKPIKFVEGNPRNLVSFSTFFSFSLSSENGDGLAFVMVPIGFPPNVFDGASFGVFGEGKFKVLGVEFDTVMDAKHSDVNGNHVGIDISSPVSVKVSNVSSIKLVLNSGEKMQAWIDYEPGLTRLEVRLSRLGQTRPINPLLSYPIDLSRMWKDEELFVGLSSSSGNSLQKCNVYSWSLKLRQVPLWLHSQPLDPNAFLDPEKMKAPADHKRNDCLSRILAALILGVGCGGLGALIVLLVWTIFGNRRQVVPEEYAMQTVEFDYKKFKGVVDKAIENGKK